LYSGVNFQCLTVAGSIEQQETTNNCNQGWRDVDWQWFVALRHLINHSLKKKKRVEALKLTRAEILFFNYF